MLRKVSQVVREPHVLEHDFDSRRLVSNAEALSAIGYARRGVEQCEDSLGARHRRLQDIVFLGQVLKRLEEPAYQLEKGGDSPDAERGGVHPRRPSDYKYGEGDCREKLDRG